MVVNAFWRRATGGRCWQAATYRVHSKRPEACRRLSCRTLLRPRKTGSDPLDGSDEKETVSTLSGTTREEQIKKRGMGQMDDPMPGKMAAANQTA